MRQRAILDDPGGSRRTVSVARVVAGLSAIWAFLLPVVAFACPVCAQREPESLARKIALGSFILLPFLVAAAVLLFLKKALRDEQKQLVRRREAQW